MTETEKSATLQESRAQEEATKTERAVTGEMIRDWVQEDGFMDSQQDCWEDTYIDLFIRSLTRVWFNQLGLKYIR
jgi:hypothetical protein